MKKIPAIVASAVMLTLCSQAKDDKVPSKSEQLADLKSKQILVAMWGWEPELMAPAAKKFGFEVVNQPQNNDITQHAIDIPIWAKEDLGMIVRPHLFGVKDPFDEEQVQAGFADLQKVIEFHEANNSNAVAYVIQWGMFGEGGFEWGYSFSDKAKAAFNQAMGTPGMALPKAPEHGVPGSIRYIKWVEFRAKTLTDFRERFVKFAKQFTDKLVGTWSEVYPVDNYVLNMGDAPGADFMFYDLSFGDVTCNQRIAFGESHGEMEAYATFEAWLDHELPLMAKAAGEGVTPISFQFPMRAGHEVNNIAGREQYSIEKIEDEYSLKIGPYIKQLIEATKGQKYNPEVALVYHSFQASALPGGTTPKFKGNYSALPLYYSSTKQIESSLHQMGVAMEAIPYEWLEHHDLSQYKLVIVPDPMYLNDSMKANLKHANKVLYTGEYLMAHRDVDSEEGNYLDAFSAKTTLKDNSVLYFKHSAGPIIVEKENPLMKGVDFGDHTYPADQMFRFSDMPVDTEVLAKINDLPILFKTDSNTLHLANRAFNQAWNLEEDWLENGMFTFLKNLVEQSGAKTQIASVPQARANLSYEYGSYGVCGNIAWNKTGQDITIKLVDESTVIIPKFGWKKID